MWRLYFILVTGCCFATAQTPCPPIPKFYVDCGTLRTINNSILFCAGYHMTLVNLTNSSSLLNDTAILNGTLVSTNCLANFWFSSGSQVGYVASSTTLGTVITNLLTGVGLVLGAILNFITCILICPVTTTPPPITQAVTVCVRPLQQRVQQKCLAIMQPMRPDMQTYLYTEQSVYGGILDIFPCRSQAVCSGACASNNTCIGTTYNNGNCTRYL